MRHGGDEVARRRLAAVAGDVDHLARGGDAVAVERAHGVGETRPQSCPAGSAARLGAQHGGEAGGVRGGSHHDPRRLVGRDRGLGPDEQRDRDRGGRTGADRRHDGAVLEGCRNAVELQPELAVVDARRGVDGKDQLEVDGRLAEAASGDGQHRDKRQSKPGARNGEPTAATPRSCGTRNLSA